MQLTSVVRHLRSFARQAATDAEVLGRFLQSRDEAAFDAIARRHGPMVLGVCRRLLRTHDAEDAFQATFLVLIRKAHSIRPREMLAGWLHGVAYQTALKARSNVTRRAMREKQVVTMPEPKQKRISDVTEVIDEALNQLPEKYRVPIVLWRSTFKNNRMWNDRRQSLNRCSEATGKRFVVSSA